MALSNPVELAAASDDTNRTTGSAYTTAAFTPTANALILIAYSQHGETTDPTVAGHSLTWTQVNAVNFNPAAGGGDRLMAYRAQVGASPSNGSVTFDPGGTCTGAQWKVWEYTGHDTTTPIVQSNPNAIDASDALATTLSAGSAGNHTNLIGAWDISSVTWTDEASYVEIGTQITGAAPSSSLHATYLTSVDTSPSATLSAARDWGAISFEVKAAAGSAVTRDPGVGAATLTGLAAVLARGLLMSLGTVAFTGHAPALSESGATQMTPDQDALVLTGPVAVMGRAILMPDEL